MPDHLDEKAVEAVVDTLDERRRTLTREHGGALADRLVTLCETNLTGTTGDDTDGDDTDGGAAKARPLVLATIDLDALLDTTRTPGWLLHTLTGGRMKVSATALQRLVDTGGADMRTIVLDDCGQAVGVCRRTHIPPSWLRQVILGPRPDRPRPRPDLPGPTGRPRPPAPVAHGPTDVTNLHPVGRRWHNHKTSKAWTVTRTRDGTTTWTHRRHRWTLRLAPPRRDLARPPDPGPPRPPPPTLPLADP